MSARQVRLVDRDGAFVGWLKPEDAEGLCAAGRAAPEGARRKPQIRLTATARVEDFKGPKEMPSGPGFTYSEYVGGKRITMLKRNIGGQFVGWHPDLTFDQLRAGLVRPPLPKRRAA